MKLPHSPRWRDRAPLSATIEAALTAGVLVLMIVSLGAVAVLLTSAMASPAVGDVLMFKQGAPIAGNDILSARRSNIPARCDLNPAIMAEGGGSIVIEAESTSNAVYRVHWAGTRTATGAEDCGRTADLELSRHDLQTLIGAIGGRGFGSQGNAF